MSPRNLEDGGQPARPGVARRTSVSGRYTPPDPEKRAAKAARRKGREQRKKGKK